MFRHFEQSFSRSWELSFECYSLQKGPATGCFCALTLQRSCTIRLFSRYKSKERAGHPFPPHQPPQPSLQFHSTDFPATGTTPAWLLQGSCCCVALGQYRTVQMLMFLCSHIPSWVSVSAVGEQILSPSSEGSSGTRATCKYHLQNAVSRWNSRFTSPQFPSLPAPATLLLFFAINSPAAEGKIMSLHPPFHISPLRSSSNAILPPITVFCWPCRTN